MEGSEPPDLKALWSLAGVQHFPIDAVLVFCNAAA